MADNGEPQVTSTTSLLNDEVHHYEPEPDLEQPKADHFSLEDIVDLVGGAQDALERHIAEDSAPTHEVTETLVEEHPVTLEEPIKEPEPVVETATSEAEPLVVPEPEPVVVVPEPEPVVVPEPEPVVVPEPEPVVVPEPVCAAPEPVAEAALPDSTTPTIVPEIQPEESVVVAPKAEPEITFVEPEPLVPEPEPAPAPVPVSDALPVAEPRKEEAPAPAEAAEQPAVTEEPPAPAAYVSSAPKAQPQPLMQFPTALGQKGDSPAPISPLSPLHSPDSLEELSLTESPNQPPTSGSAAPLGSFSIQPPTTHSKDMPWEGEESSPGHGRSKNQDDLLDPLAGPYLSLGKDPVAHNPCEDSGVSFSPEEKLVSSDKSSTGPSPVTPQMMLPESDLASSNPTEHWDSPFLASQDNSKSSMDPFSKESAPKSVSKYESDLLQSNNSDDDDDLMYEMKKNNNPFDGFSPLADSGYSHFGDSKPDSRATKMSESPTPDLVQYGQMGEPLDSPPSFLDEEEIFGKKSSDSLMQSLSQFSTGAKEITSVLKDEKEETRESNVPPGPLPDILKSSPLNPDKADSGSSEGTPEDQSPILERKMMESPNPPINLSNNPFAFEGKVSLLKEMAEEMEERAAEHAKNVEEQTFGAFDLVKEAEETTPTKVKEEEPVKIEQKDWFSGFDSPKKPDKLEPLDLKRKRHGGSDSDSESHTADSLSPVLEAMGKNPASFQVELEKKDIKMEEPEVAEEVSEHEVSSEEFEFIERPPRGVIDEFLEALDTSKFATSKAPEIPMDDDLTFGRKEEVPPPTKVTPSLLMDDEVSSQTSYHLLTQSSPQKSKAELEKLDIQQPPPKAPVTHSPVQKPEGPLAKKSSLFKMPSLNVKQVVDLLYWRDVKSTGAVFGATLLLLLSLTMCSIVSVCSYIGLALLSVTICFRIYKGILQAIQKSDEGHPFKQYLDKEVALSEDMVHKYSDMALSKINKSIADLRRLFLVEDLVDSIKFAVLMWILTYVGALFNGLTLVILAVVAVFSCPIVYEKHQEQIDHYLAMVNNQIKDVVGKIQAKVPGMKRKTE